MTYSSLQIATKFSAANASVTMNLFDLGTVFLFWAFVQPGHGQNCPILGPAYPAVIDPVSSTVLQQAKSASDEALKLALSNGALKANATSFSIRVFSSYVDGPIYEYHHTADTPNNGSGLPSTRQVGPETLYRIGSIAKLVSVYAILSSKLSDRYWDEPVTKYVEELATAPSGNQNDAVDKVQWSEVTLGGLASQMSGIGRDCKCFLARFGKKKKKRNAELMV